MSNNSAISNTEMRENAEILAPAVRNMNNFAKSLFKKWWLFLIVGAAAGIAGFWYAGTQKAVYQSRLTFALDEGNDGGLSGALNLAAQFGLSMGDSKSIFSGDNILAILKSRRMVEDVLLSVDSFNNKPYTLIGYFLDIQKKPGSTPAANFPPGLPKASFSYIQDSVLFSVYTKFSGAAISAQRPDKKLSIYEVNVTTPDERLSKVFTDRLVAATNNFYIEICSKKTKQTLEVLEQRVAAMKGGLNASISGRAAVQDANLNPAFASSQIPVLKEQVNMQVYSSAYAEMLKNLEMARFQYLNTIPLMQIIDQTNYPMKKIKAGKLKTAAVFSFLSAVVIVFLFWIIRLIKMESGNSSRNESWKFNKV